MENDEILCDNCGKELLEDDKFCPKCGNSLNNEKQESLGEEDLNNENNALDLGEENKEVTCSHCGEKLIEDDKFCPNCGKSKGIAKNKLIIGVIALIAIFTIISGVLLSGLNSQTQSIDENNANTSNVNEGVFPNAIQVNGITFHIPDGYEYVYDPEFPDSYHYEKGLSGITITVQSGVSIDEGRQNLISNGRNPIGTVIGGYSGYKVIMDLQTAFIFEKEGALFMIFITNDLNDEDIAKIIK